MHHPTDRIAHTTAFVTPVVEHWLEREIAQWVHPMKDRSDDPLHHERTLYLCATSRSCFTKAMAHTILSGILHLLPIIKTASHRMATVAFLLSVVVNHM